MANKKKLTKKQKEKNKKLEDIITYILILLIAYSYTLGLINLVKYTELINENKVVETTNN